MKFIKLTIMAAMMIGLLGACSDDTKTNTTASKEEKYVEIPQEAINSTVEDMKGRENIADATFEVKGNKIEMKLTVKNVSDADSAIPYADSFLRTTSVYVGDSNPTESSYGEVYDGYYVNITVEDPNGIQLLEGDLLPGFSSITWK